MKKSLLSLLLVSNAYMSDPADSASAAPQTPAEGDPVNVSGDVPTTPAPVTVTVPAEHADLIQRAVALLERGESWLKDNIEAGISHFESLFKNDAEAPKE